MGRKSDRSVEQPTEDGRAVARVHDLIAIPRGIAAGAIPGLAVILEAFPDEQPERFVGGTAWFDATDPERAARILAVRDHGATISLLLEGLTKADLPIGTAISFVPGARTELAPGRPVATAS